VTFAVAQTAPIDNALDSQPDRASLSSSNDGMELNP
jgi:hypothetical protein